MSNAREAIFAPAEAHSPEGGDLLASTVVNAAIEHKKIKQADPSQVERWYANYPSGGIATSRRRQSNIQCR